MVTPSRAQRYSDDQAKVVGLARRELDGFWRTLDKSNPVAAKAALQDFMVALVEGYGPISATLAADYYDEIRDAAGARGRFTAAPVEAVEADRIRSSAAWAAQPVFSGDEAGARARLTGIAQRYVQESGRQTLIANARRDRARPRYARSPHGKTCAWCILLASRGAVYHSEETAGALGNFHDDCDCQIVPAFDDDDLPYDVDAMNALYIEGRKNATGNTDKAIAASMRELGIGADAHVSK